MRYVLISLLLLIHAQSRDQCPEQWDGPTACFNQLGSYPLKHLRASRGVTLAEVMRILGKPSSRVTRKEPNADYPGVEDRIIITLKYPQRSVVLSRAVSDERFEIDRFEERNVAIQLNDCAIHNGQTRHEIFRLLGLKKDDAIWHHMWCQRGLTYEEWATVTLQFSGGRLSSIVWQYWAD